MSDPSEEQGYDDLERLTTVYDDGGRPVIRVGLLATYYLEGPYRREVRESVAACFDLYREVVGDCLRWAKHPGNLHFFPTTDSTVPSPRDWFRELGEDDSWQFHYRGGDDIEVADTFTARALGGTRESGDLGYFRVTLPLTWFATHPGKFPPLALEFARLLRPLHGYGGLGIIESQTSEVQDEFAPAVYALAHRFPGLEVDYPVGHTLWVQEGIKGVNWLTFLDDRWPPRLGGLDALRQALGPEFSVVPYPGGVMIQAGSHPQLGDRERGLKLDLSERAARVFKPIRIKQHRAFQRGGPGVRFDRAASEAWLSRFG